jgi:tetratricopeptide (TPR) repeat protein
MDKDQELCDHIAGCAQCQALLREMSDEPDLQRTASRRWPSTEPAADEPALARLLEEMQATPPPAVSRSGNPPELGDTLLEFLSPPQQDGDLGTLGPYRVLAELGRGGMGIVLLSYDQELRRTVALKVLPPHRADPKARARFVREAQAAAGVDHDHIVQVHAVANPADGPPYFVMQYVQGPTLRQRIKQDGRLEAREAARICGQVAEGLAAAHQAGLIHRDIKPGNVIIDQVTGRAKIMDFGLVRVASVPGGTTQEGAIPGTPEYMSPEQVRDPEHLDARTDIYSLGVTMYEALTGEVPFRGVAHMVHQQILQDEPRPPRRLNDQIPRDLETICLKALAKEPSRRYGSARDMADDLGRYLKGEAILARPMGRGERLWRWCRRNKGPVVAASIIAMSLVGGIIGTSLGMVRARHSADAERLAKQEALAETGKALAAQEEERRARQTAQKRLAQIVKSNNILVSVFRNLDPKAEEKEGKSLRVLLGERLDEAVKQLEGEAVGDPVAVAAMQTWLGNSLRELGHLDQAQIVLEKARQTVETPLGPGHPDTLTALRLLARLYKDRGSYDKAEPLFKQVLEARRQQLGPDHPETLTSMHDLASLYWAGGSYDDAEPLFKQVLEDRRRQLGPNDLHTLSTMSDLAALYHMRGLYDDAEPLYRQVLEGRRHQLAPDHSATLLSMNNLAVLYRARGRYDEAEPLFKQVLEARRLNLGPDHPDTLMSMNNLASLYWNMKKLDRSIPLFEECRKRQMAKLGPDHPETLRTLGNLGVNYRDAGRLEEGIRCLEEALARARNRPAPLPVELTRIRSMLATTYDRANQFAKSEGLYREFADEARQQFGADNPRTARTLAQLGSNLLQQKKYSDAESVLRESLAIREKKEPDIWTTFSTKSMLGGALLGQNKYADAELLLLQGYQGMKQRQAISPEGKIRQTEALERLVQLYDAWGKEDEATNWRKELDERKRAAMK